MKLILNLINGKRVQRTRLGGIVVQNDKRHDGRIIACFYDEWEFNNKCIPIPFAEFPVKIIKSFKGAIPVISTFAK